MKYWIVYWSINESKYKLRDTTDKTLIFECLPDPDVATFKQFDMAYDYVTKLNSNCMNNAYSRWTVR